MAPIYCVAGDCATEDYAKAEALAELLMSSLPKAECSLLPQLPADWEAFGAAKARALGVPLSQPLVWTGAGAPVGGLAEFEAECSGEYNLHLQSMPTSAWTKIARETLAHQKLLAAGPQADEATGATGAERGRFASEKLREGNARRRGHERAAAGARRRRGDGRHARPRRRRARAGAAARCRGRRALRRAVHRHRRRRAHDRQRRVRRRRPRGQGALDRRRAVRGAHPRRAGARRTRSATTTRCRRRRRRSSNGCSPPPPAPSPSRRPTRAPRRWRRSSSTSGCARAPTSSSRSLRSPRRAQGGEGARPRPLRRRRGRQAALRLRVTRERARVDVWGYGKRDDDRAALSTGAWHTRSQRHSSLRFSHRMMAARSAADARAGARRVEAVEVPDARRPVLPSVRGEHAVLGKL